MRLPRRANETWQGGLVRARVWVEEPDGNVRRPLAAVWVSLTTGLVNVQLTTAEDPESHAAVALQVLVDLGLKFARGRPAHLEVADGALGAQLAAALGDPELSVTVRADLPAVDRMLREMERADHDAAAPPDALDAPGVTVERMRAFAAAAREFYQAEPWQHLSDEDLIHVEAPTVASGLKYLTVLGAAGVTVGLGFFPSPQDFEALQEEPDPETLVSDWDRWSVVYGPIEDIAVRRRGSLGATPAPRGRC